MTDPGRGNQNLLGSRRSSEDPPDDGRPRGLLTVVSNRFLVPAAYVILRRDEQVLLQLRMNTGYRDDYWATAAAGMSKQGSQGTGHQRDRGPYRQSRAAGFRASPWVVGWQGGPVRCHRVCSCDVQTWRVGDADLAPEASRNVTRLHGSGTDQPAYSVESARQRHASCCLRRVRQAWH